jgi:hypothetical protein
VKEIKAMSDNIGTAFLNGIEDRHTHGLLRVEQLYRRPRRHKLAWRLGWWTAHLLTVRPMRTGKRR